MSFLALFQGRDELVVYKHMWSDGAPHERRCEGATAVVPPDAPPTDPHRMAMPERTGRHRRLNRV